MADLVVLEVDAVAGPMRRSQYAAPATQRCSRRMPTKRSGTCHVSTHTQPKLLVCGSLQHADSHPQLCHLVPRSLQLLNIRRLFHTLKSVTKYCTRGEGAQVNHLLPK